MIQKNDPKIIRAWCMYDWANSVYSLVITSAIFPVYYQAVTSSQDSETVSFFGFEMINSVLYSYSLSFSFLITALILPILSGIADYGGQKKRYLKIFVTIGSLACMGLFFFDSSNIEWGIFCAVLASIGYSSGLVFYDAFLPEIAEEGMMDKVSAKGYSYGYVGSVILLIASLLIIQFYNELGFPDEGTAVRLSFLLVGVWWLGFSQITFHYLPDNVHGRKPGKNLLANGYLEIRKVWFQLKSLPNMRAYLLAFFFYNMGVQTVMYLAATFGSKELKLESTKLILTVLIIQIVAIGGATLFAKVSEIWGNKFSLLTMNFIWVFICLGAYFVTKEVEFYLLATVVGLVMGGIQSLSRSTFAKLIPEETIDHASFFSFYDVTFNISIVFGTFSYGAIEQISGNMRNSTIALCLFFVLGIIFLTRLKMRPVKH
jgi:UMF1 family MFS transporter